MCINKKVTREANGNGGVLMALCKRHVKNNTCYYKNQVANTAESFILQRGFSKAQDPSSTTPSDAKNPFENQKSSTTKKSSDASSSSKSGKELKRHNSKNGPQFNMERKVDENFKVASS